MYYHVCLANTDFRKIKNQTNSRDFIGGTVETFGPYIQTYIGKSYSFVMCSFYHCEDCLSIINLTFFVFLCICIKESAVFQRLI